MLLRAATLRRPSAVAASRLVPRLLPRHCWARTDDAHLDPVVPSPDRVLHATIRGNGDVHEFGQYRCKQMRKAGRIPCNLVGDRLPYVPLSIDREALLPLLRRTHVQRELLTLKVEGGVSPFEGEEVLVLPQQIRLVDRLHFEPEHIQFRRWPRDPERNPVKMNVPIVFTHEDKIPKLKSGYYLHEMFEVGQGLKCTVRQREHIPRFIEADMRRADDGDLRFEHIDMPPGVAPVRCVRVLHTSRPRTPHTHGPTSPPVHAERRYRGKRTEGNFLVGRVVRISGH